ncbi:MAG TPA: hypothetical protein VG498_24225 [Terriglobales bacterium]|nr:hypothetical protein [Terriglobales bacterium]
MKNDATQGRSDFTTLSDREIWAAIRYLDGKQQRGIADLLVCVVLCWMVLFFCTAYLILHLRT